MLQRTDHVRTSAVVSLALTAVLAWLPGSAAAQATRFAYTVNNLGNSVSIDSINPTSGALVSVGTVATQNAPIALVVDPSARFLYVANLGSNSVSAFRINPATGGLTTTGTAATGVRPVAIVAEPTGRFVYVVNNASATVTTFAINSATGGLQVLRTDPFGVRPVSMAVHPSGRFLYVVDAGTARVLVATINAGTGLLTPLGSLPTGGSSPGAVAVEPRGRHLYVVDEPADLTTVVRINATTGVLTTVQFVDTKNPVALTAEKTGRFLYVVSPENNAVFVNGIDQATGQLTNVSTSVLSVAAPDSVTIDPTNRFLYTNHGAEDRVTRMVINQANGSLAESGNAPRGNRPAAMTATHPAERFAFAHELLFDSDSQRVESLRVDANTGALTTIQSTLIGDLFKREVAVEPTGRFLYVLNGGGNTESISAFGIQLGTGQLTSIQNMAFPPQSGAATAISIDPTGRFLYTACLCNTLDTRIRVFRINANGTLTALGGGGGAGNLSAQTGTVDISGRFLFMASDDADVVERFAINPTSGAVTSLGTTPTSPLPGAVALDPLGRFLFVANRIPNNPLVDAFRIGATGTLTAAGTIAMSSFVESLNVDRTGRFLLAARNDGGVETLLIDPTTGALATAAFPPAFAPPGTDASTVAMDATGRFTLVGHGAPGLEPGGGIRTFRINPATGSLVLASDFETAGSAERVLAGSRIR